MQRFEAKNFYLVDIDFIEHVYPLAKYKTAKYFTKLVNGIAHPECRQRLRAEIGPSEYLGRISDTMHIYLHRFHGDSVIMREISFRAVGEEPGGKRDMDRYDLSYEQIILWDQQALEIVGSYRVLMTEHRNTADLYRNTIFSYTDEAKPIMCRGFELGRSFIQAILSD